jgi:hypothetical protein
VGPSAGPDIWEKRKKILAPTGIRTTGHPTRTLLSILTMLYQSLESVTDTGYLTKILQLYTLCRNENIVNYKLGKPEKKTYYFLGQNSHVKADGCKTGVLTTQLQNSYVKADGCKTSVLTTQLQNSVTL